MIIGYFAIWIVGGEWDECRDERRGNAVLYFNEIIFGHKFPFLSFSQLFFSLHLALVDSLRHAEWFACKQPNGMNNNLNSRRRPLNEFLKVKFCSITSCLHLRSWVVVWIYDGNFLKWTRVSSGFRWNKHLLAFSHHNCSPIPIGWRCRVHLRLLWIRNNDLLLFFASFDGICTRNRWRGMCDSSENGTDGGIRAQCTLHAEVVLLKILSFATSMGHVVPV